MFSTDPTVIPVPLKCPKCELPKHDPDVLCDANIDAWTGNGNTRRDAR